MRTEQMIIEWITRSTFYHAHFWTPYYFNASDAAALTIVLRPYAPPSTLQHCQQYHHSSAVQKDGDCLPTMAWIIQIAMWLRVRAFANYNSRVHSSDALFSNKDHVTSVLRIEWKEWILTGLLLANSQSTPFLISYHVSCHLLLIMRGRSDEESSEESSKGLMPLVNLTFHGRLFK